MNKSKFNHAVGKMIGMFGILYCTCALGMGMLVLIIGTHDVLTDWYTKYKTVEGVFWIFTSCIGILLLAIALVFGPALTVKEGDG